jgi:hypothetical protein
MVRASAAVDLMLGVLARLAVSAAAAGTAAAEECACHLSCNKTEQ